MFISAVTVFFFATTTLLSQSVQHLGTTQPGGMPGQPVMGGVERLANGVRVTWDGPSGYYQVYQKNNGLLSPWAAVGQATNLVRYAVITKLYNNAFFRVSGPAPKYAGSQVCLTCHLSICRYVTNTRHASAFSSPKFKTLGGQTNPSCLPCHTVGYGLPTGFVSATATPLLAGVQCENCHGPAANHAAATDDPTVVPRVEIAATVCGGCHSASHSAYTNAPTFEEWTTSGHAAVTPEVLASMSASANNISSCGRCHSGSARLALINGLNPVVTLANDYNVAITCVVCHDPHQTNANPAQLRNPVSSTKDFFLATSDVFTNKYSANTNINLCGQCHNDRGAAWTDTAQAPHRSPQYNFLLGSVGELLNGSSTFSPGTHAGLPSTARYSISGTFYLTNQCVACHMQSDSRGAPNHSMLITSDTVCLNCHLIPPAVLEEFYLTPVISNSVTTLITALNRWAAKQTNSLLATHGVVAWEYTNPGGLTWRTNSAGNVTGWTLNNPVTFTGPGAAGQALIPDRVKRTRFNLYLVLNDGSFGVHNPTLAINLLNAAQIWMVQVLQ
ncbi:MAG TPA: cytochrome c family protein [Verrucomicrobiae bacterium]